MSGIVTTQTLSWAQPVAGAFQQSGAWDAGGQPTGAVPNIGTVAVFATGSATPYAVAATGQARQIQVIGDQVTFDGDYLGLFGAADPLSPCPSPIC